MPTYSPLETKALEIVRRGRVSSSDLIIGLYPDGSAPHHAQQSVRGIMKSLARKVATNGEKFSIVNSERAGPIPMEFWVEKPKKKRAK